MFSFREVDGGAAESVRCWTVVKFRRIGRVEVEYPCVQHRSLLQRGPDRTVQTVF